MRKIYKYSKERFPLQQFVPLSLLFVLVMGVLIQNNTLGSGISYYTFIWPFLALFLFLFRLRLFDEFKDYDHDLKYYPNRPVARGFIKLSELFSVILVISFFEIIIGFSNLYTSLILFMVTFLYSLLMFKEFFCAAWLKKHFTMYILSHEILVIPLFFYTYSLFGLDWAELSNSFIWILTIFLGGQLFLLEITRKFRSKDMEIGSKDTYTAQYGIRGASFLVFIISSLVIVAYFYLAIHSFSNILFIGVAAVILFAVLWLKIFSFMNKANTYQAKQVFNYAIFFTLGMDLLIIIKSFFS
jgi:heme O synthase-like polyprenyltransferase